MAKRLSDFSQSTGVTLAGSLVTGRVFAYCVKRLAMPAQTTILNLFLRALEVLFISQNFSGSQVFFVLCTRTLVQVFNTASWGALEQLRQKVRDLQKKHGKRDAVQHICNTVGQYFELVIFGTAILEICLIAFLTARVLGGGIAFFEIYALLSIACAPLSICIQVIQSGVTANRRIPRTLLSLSLGQVCGVLVAISTYSQLGSLSFLLALLVSTALNDVMRLCATLREYDFEYLARPPILFPNLKKFNALVKSICSKPMFESAAAAVCMSIDSLLWVFVMFESRASGAPDLVLLLFWIQPLFLLVERYAQFFYIDLQSLRQSIFANARQRLMIGNLKAAFLMGIVCCGVIFAGAHFLLLGQHQLIPLYAVLLLRSGLGFLQMKEFVNGHYHRFIFAGVAAGFVAIIMFCLGASALVSMTPVSLAFVTVFLLSRHFLKSRPIHCGARALDFFDFCRHLSITPAGACVLRLRQPLGEKGMRVLVNHLQGRIGSADALSLFANDVLIWTDSSALLSLPQVVVLTGGNIGSYQQGLSLVELHQLLLKTPYQPVKSDLLQVFARDFAAYGLAVEWTKSQRTPLSNELGADLFFCAKKNALNPWNFSTSKQFDAIPWCPDGVIKTIFLLDKQRCPRQLRHRFIAQVQCANLAALF